jgi:trigger factor
MKTSVENISSLGRRLRVEISAQDVAKSFDRVYKKIQRESHLKGFRPGKAPMTSVRSAYGSQATQDVAQELIYGNYPSAVKENALDPISYPEFEFDPPALEKDFVFSAQFEVRPEVALKKYEKLELEKENFVMEQKKIDEVVENIKQSHAEWIDLLEVRPAQKGDLSVIDFDGFVDGAPLEQGQGSGFHLELGTDRFIPGFEEGVVGMKVGEEKRLKLNFPQEYQAAHLSGKPVEFVVTLKGLKKKKLPEFTPEFLKEKLGGVESIEKLKENVAQDIERTEKRRIENDFRNRLLRTLVLANPFDVPKAMVEEQKEILVRDMKDRFVQQGMQESQFSEYEDKWKADFETTAQEIVKSSFIVDAIAKKHGLHGTEADFNTKLEGYVKQTGIEMERVREFYTKEEQAQKLSYMITEEKVIEFLMKTATIKLVAKVAGEKE